MNKAKDCKECEGCKHRFVKEPNLFCYMFKDKPDVVPCGQHDKYEVERKVTAMLFKKYPAQMKFALSVMLNDGLLTGMKAGVPEDDGIRSYLSQVAADYDMNIEDVEKIYARHADDSTPVEFHDDLDQEILRRQQ